MEKRIVIIDGNSLMNRAYYAMQRPMMTREGVYTQGIYGFLNMLNKIMNDYEPGYIAVAWDRKTPTFRHKEYDAYKAGRRKMPPELAMEFPLIKDILDAMKIRQMELDGFEADDIIGTVAKRSEREGLDPLIITGDKDALQLASDKIKVMVTKRGISEFDLYDKDKMLERYHLTPEQFIDLKGLMGDQSDNIPGIPGIGEKTGIKLLEEFGSVAELIANTEKISAVKLREKVEDNADLAVMSRRLATIITDVPVEYETDELKVQEPDVDRLVDLYQKLELNSFLKKLSADTGSAVEADDPSDYARRVLSVSELKEIDLNGKEVFLHVFGNGDHVNDPVVTGIALLDGKDYYYIKIADGAEFAEAAAALAKARVTISGHSLSQDLYMLMKGGYEDPKPGFDTEIAAYLLDPSKSGYELKVLVLEEFRIEIRTDKEFSKEAAQTDLLGENDKLFEERGFEILRFSSLLKAPMEKKLADFGMTDLMKNVEMKVVPVLASMEVEGMSVDKSMLSETGEQLDVRIKELEQGIYDATGEVFNINSPKQLGDVLFGKLGLPSGKKTKSGYSTSADILEKVKDEHPSVAMVLEYRTLTKLRSTYVDGLVPLIGKDGKIHCHFQQTVAATGRLSCTEPNLQNIPVRQELGRTLRKAFVAEEGRTFLGADYSQIELRLMAHLSGDPALIEAFNNGEDIHRKTASRVFGIDYDKVTKLDRSRAKAVNFGIIYGMSGFGLAQDIHVSRKEAEQYIADYFEKHKDVKAYMDGQVEHAKETGYSETILGRRRYIPEIRSGNFMVRQLGERLAMNSPIQGSAADIIKIAMVRVYEEIRKRGLRSRLILQIHDELIIDTFDEEKEEIRELLKTCMEDAMQLKVKLLCDMGEAKNWYDLK